MGGLALAEIGHYLAVGPNVEEDVEDHHHEFEEEDRKGAKMVRLRLAMILESFVIERLLVLATGYS